jgi:hypothetical protein
MKMIEGVAYNLSFLKQYGKWNETQEIETEKRAKTKSETDGNWIT